MICGLQTFSDSLEEDRNDWLENVVLLRDPDDEIGSISPSLTRAKFLRRTEVYQREAQTEGFRPRSEASPIEVTSAYTAAEPGLYRKRMETGTIPVIVFPKGLYLPPYRNLSAEHHIPLHRSCLQLAERLWTVSPDTSYIRDLRGLFLALAWRYTLGVKSNSLSAYSSPPNYRLADDFHLKRVVWKRTEKNQGESPEDMTELSRDPMHSDRYVSLRTHSRRHL
jgi:hypothetical protein